MEHGSLNRRTLLRCPLNLSGNDGAPLPSGIYLYRAKVSETGVSSESSVKKLIIIRK